MEVPSKIKHRQRYQDPNKDLTLLSYLKSELKRGYLLENDEERYAERREKVYTFFMIPRETEKFFAYGFFQCADSFTFVLTFLPLRFVLACWAFVFRLFTWILRLVPPPERLLKPAEVVDLVKGVLLVTCCYLMAFIDTSVYYHLIKTQSTIKLYLFFNMLEIADRLMSAFGQDTLDALFWTATEPGGRKRERVGGFVFHLLVALVSVFLHASIVLLQALALNVAINADNKGLLTILISNNFVELKGSVFKKFDRINLLQISCSDVRERFHMCILMVVVALQTLKEYNWSEERLYILLPDCLMVCLTEVLVDWIKHAFVTRFNEIPIEAYRDYTTILAHDLVMCKQKYADSDHSDLVARRMGFIPLPLGVVTIRILSQSLPLHNATAYLLLALAFLAILTFRVLNGIVMLGKACDLIQDAEKRKTQADTEASNSKQADETTFKTSSNTNTSMYKSPDKYSAKPPSTACDVAHEKCSCSALIATRTIPTIDCKVDDKNGLESPSPCRTSPLMMSSTPIKCAAAERVKAVHSSFSSNISESSVLNDSDEAVTTALYSTPFTTPTHLVKRVKGKRVRLDSGAMVHEIEPYYCSEISSEDDSVQPTSEKNLGKHKLRLSLGENHPVQSDQAVAGKNSFGSTPNSPGPYDTSLSFNNDTRGGLMANSMVNLASVGLNQGPHSPEEEHPAIICDIVNKPDIMQSSDSDKIWDDDTLSQLVVEISLEEQKDKESTSDNNDAVLNRTVNVNESDSDKLNEMSDNANSRTQQSNLSFSFKAASAPDVRINDDSDEDETG